MQTIKYKKIHIFGASGSGTTTLGRFLSKELGYKHFDTDDYYWIETNPPYQIKRSVEERQKLLLKDLTESNQWVWSGAMTSWAEPFIPLFDLVVYLWLPKEIRLERLAKREAEDFGDKILPGGAMYETYMDFMDWAGNYDNDNVDFTRCRKNHNAWIKMLPCKVIRIEGDFSLEKKLEIIETS
ncbi:MAG: AAA family ATPase [Blastocatellia bacterium]